MVESLNGGAKIQFLNEINVACIENRIEARSAASGASPEPAIVTTVEEGSEGHRDDDGNH